MPLTVKGPSIHHTACRSSSNCLSHVIKRFEFAIVVDARIARRDQRRPTGRDEPRLRQSTACAA
jgi:hypothetical protein